MLRSLACACACGLCFSTSNLKAEVTFDWATVGNPGNAADQDYGDGQFGAVSDVYRISKHEVTNDQYAEFLNAVAATDSFPGDDPTLYNGGMVISQSGSSGSFSYSVVPGFGPNPVHSVSFFDSMRFVNWLENGQGSGDTESGVYTISDGVSETRAATATFFLPSEDEWYKAAYYDPRLEAAGGPPGDDNYWSYPTQSNSTPSCVSPPAAANSANCSFAVGDTTDVGAYTNTTNFYGTFDQGGNVFEWNESVFGSSSRSARGGSWNILPSYTAAWNRVNNDPTIELRGMGLRVANIVPGDFNDDGFYDCDDIDALIADIVGPGTPEAFDLTGDDIVDLDDRDAWLAFAAAANGFGSPYLLGDADLSGTVDFIDLNMWSEDLFTPTPAWCAGDWDASGVPDFIDLNLWSENLFQSSDSPTPEPSSLLLGAFSALGLLLRRRS